jgi:hypothetical protein
MSSPSRFTIHDMRSIDAARRRRSRHWDFRFVMAVLLLYGCVGVAFFAVEWMHAAPDNKPPTVQELNDSRTGRTGLHPVVRPLALEPPGTGPAEGR